MGSDAESQHPSLRRHPPSSATSDGGDRFCSTFRARRFAVDDGLFDEHTGLLVVDVQNDFADPDGAAYVPGGEGVVPVINRLIDAARRAKAFVSYTQDWHPASTPHFDTDGGAWPVHCVQGTWGAELHADLEIAGPVIRKGAAGEDAYSAFLVFDFKT